MHLDKTSVKILKYIRNNHPVKTEDIDTLIGNKPLAEDCIKSLISKNYIKGLTPNTYFTPSGVKCVNSSPYTIAADGLAYLENIKHEKNNNRRQFMRDLFIALLSAFLSNADRLCPFISEQIKNLIPS